MNSQQATSSNAGTRERRFTVRFPKKSVLAIVAAATILGSLSLLSGTTAEAHTGSFWAGTHYTNGARCDRLDYGQWGKYTWMTFRAPTVFATLNDAKPAQPVAWRPRLVAVHAYTNQWTQSYGNVQYETARDTLSAPFTDQPLYWHTSNNPIHLYIDFFFYSTTTGQLVDQSTHYLGYCY